MTDIERVGVVGCGLMGSGIAEVCARAGLDVTVVETSPAAADAGLGRIEESLRRACERGKLSPADGDAALARLRVTSDLTDMADRDLVVEAVAEDEAAKTEVFAATRRDPLPTGRDPGHQHVVDPGDQAGRGDVRRPEYVVGVHFFNPVPVLKLVELVPSLLTGPRTGSAPSPLSPSSWARR